MVLLLRQEALGIMQHYAALPLTQVCREVLHVRSKLDLPHGVQLKVKDMAEVIVLTYPAIE
jgi:hypothetical protein